MTFGEKLFKLRKERGLSQEALAEKLQTSRQAISKWENGQGYPETEKLLMIGNIFEVSMDYLLKDTEKSKNDNDIGYYVSKEMAEGYLVSSQKMAKLTALGIFLLALSTIPYFIFKDEPALYIIPTIILATLGIGMFVSLSFLEESRYKVFKQEPLIFDERYLKDLQIRYENMKTRYGMINIIGIGLFVAGLLAFGIERKFITSGMLESYYPIFIGMIAIGLYIVVRTSTLHDAYKLLANNQAYTERYSFKLRRKFRKKIDEF